jgi:3D (Asp-Asp-Asp) domain-containing protein
MKVFKNYQSKRLLKRHVVSIGFLVVGLSCIIALFLSPFSPIHASSAPATWSGDSIAYNVGDVVSYDGSTYTCIEAHTSEPNWDPADAATLWTLQVGTSSSASVASGPAAWSGNFVVYKVGDVVSYDGSTYTCIQAHTSESDWDPADAATLWTLQVGTSSSATPPTATSTSTASMPTPIASTPTATPTSIVPTAVSSVSNPTATATATPIATPDTSSGGMQTVSVTFYTDEGPMADGQQTHLGACAVWTGQYPLGTMIQLYDPSNLTQPAYICTAEDTGTHICQNDIDVAMPGQTALAIQLGVESMELQVVGFDQVVAQEAVANHPASQGCELGATH